MVLVEIIIGQTIGVPHQVLNKEFLNRTKLEPLIIGEFGGKEPFDNYNSKISSFMSEYGFQSFPEHQTFKQFANKKDEDIYSQVMKYHQRSSIGNATIEEYLRREYEKPKDFESLLYMSQILQADGIKAYRGSQKK